MLERLKKSVNLNETSIRAMRAMVSECRTARGACFPANPYPASDIYYLSSNFSVDK